MADPYNHKRAPPGNNGAAQGWTAPQQDTTNNIPDYPLFHNNYAQIEAPPPSHNLGLVQYESPVFSNAHYLFPEPGNITRPEDHWQTSSSNDTGYGSQATSSGTFAIPRHPNPYPYQQDSSLSSSNFFIFSMEPPSDIDDANVRGQPYVFGEDPSQYYAVPDLGAELDSEHAGGSQPRKRRRTRSSEAQNTSDRLRPPAKIPRQNRNQTSQLGPQATGPTFNTTGAFLTHLGHPVQQGYGTQPVVIERGAAPGTTRELGPPLGYRLPASSEATLRSVLENQFADGSFPSSEKIEALSTLMDLPPQAIDFWIRTHLRGRDVLHRSNSPSVSFPSIRAARPLPATIENAAGPNPNDRLPQNVRQAIEKYVEACSKKRARGDGRRKVNNGRYACTADCGYLTKRPFDWRRHEETHQPQEFWLCEICRTAFPPKMVLVSRGDKLRPHIKNDHPEDDADDVVEQSKQDYVADFKRRCGFCGDRFESWDSRNTHILAHFDGKLEGGTRHMSEWRDTWSEEESEDGDGGEDPSDDSDDSSNDSDGQDFPHQGDHAGASGGSGSSHEYGQQQPPGNSGQQGQHGQGALQGHQEQTHGANFDYGWRLHLSPADRSLSNLKRTPSEIKGPSLQEAVVSRMKSGYGYCGSHRIISLPTDKTPNRQLTVPRKLYPSPQPEKQEHSFRVTRNVGRIIGKGTYGSVDIVENRVTKQLYARKRCQLSPDNLSGLKPFQREVKIMKMVAHRHVVRLVSAYVQDSCLNIVMSPLAQGTLRQYLDLPTMPQGSAPRIRSWVGCLSSALSYLHANRIRHADIKPQNLLVKESDVYISDFGISRIVSEPDSTSSSISPMTPMYAAPEIAQHQPHGRKADVFSLGCVVFEMLTVAQGHTVADIHRHLGISNHKKRPRSRQAYYQQQNGLVSWIENLCSPTSTMAQRGLWDVCKWMLENNAEQRPSSSLLVKYLRQLWLSQNLGTCPDCMSTTVPSKMEPMPPTLTPVSDSQQVWAGPIPAQTSFRRSRPLNPNVNPPASPRSFYYTPPATPPLTPSKGSSSYSKFEYSKMTGDASILLSKAHNIIEQEKESIDAASTADAQPYDALKLYMTVPTAFISLVPSDSGRIHLQVTFMVLPIVLISQPQNEASEASAHHPSRNEGFSNSYLPPRKESSKIEARKGGVVRLMDRQTCHVCGRLFTAPRLTDCRECGHIRCEDCPRLRHEIHEKKLPLDRDPDLTEIGSHLSPPAYSITDSTPLLEDQYVFDKIVDQNQAVEYPKEHFLQASPSTFDLLRPPVRDCRDEWWRPKTPSIDSPDLDPPRLMSEGSLYSAIQPAHKRMRLNYHIPGSEANSTSPLNFDGRRRISVRSQQTVHIRQAGSPAVFSRIRAFRKAVPAVEIAEQPFERLPPMTKSASTSTNGIDAVARLPMLKHTQSISYSHTVSPNRRRRLFGQLLPSTSHDAVHCPPILHPQLDVGPSIAVSGGALSIKSTGSKEFGSFGRRAKRTMVKFWAGGKGSKDIYE